MRQKFSTLFSCEKLVKTYYIVVYVTVNHLCVFVRKTVGLIYAYHN